MRLIIGEGISDNQGMSAISYSERREKRIRMNISQNSRLFWVHCEMFDRADFNVWILKDTEEGQRLKEMLDQNVSEDDIFDYIDLIVVKNLTPEQLVELIRKEVEVTKKKAFLQGQMDIQIKFRKLMSLEGR